MSNISLTHSGPSFNQYMDSINRDMQLSKFKGADYYLKKFNLLKGIIDLLPCAVYILDYRTRQYLFISENVKYLFGYTAAEYMEYGHEFLFTKIHPDDLVAFSSKIFGDFVEYSRSLATEDLRKTVFSLNFRIKRKDDVYIKFLQQYVILERDEFNNPLMTLGLATDITAYKPDNKMIFSVTKYNKTGNEVKIYTQHTLPVRQTISKRENEVLKLLLKGHTSKKIAETLHLSYYTVRAHRRKLLGKTNCKNSIELGNYVIKHGMV